jgi:mannose-1-phosphate guanylyltransferase
LNRVEDELFPSLASAGRAIVGFHRQGYWKDVGNPEAYRLANLDVLNGACVGRLPAGWPPDGIATAGASVGAAAKLRPPVLAGSGTLIEDGARITGPAVLGARCTIAANAEVSGSVLWDDVTVEQGARVLDSVVASGASIGSGASIEGAVIGHGARVTARTHVPPGTRVAPDTTYPEPLARAQ